MPHTISAKKLRDKKTSKPDVSITRGIFLSRANMKTFSSLVAIPSGLICTRFFNISDEVLVLLIVTHTHTRDLYKFLLGMICLF